MKKESLSNCGRRISRVKVYRIFCKRRVEREDQATKGLRRMPWYMAPKKDVTSCEKLRGGANIYRSADIRMRELSTSNIVLSCNESIVTRGEPGELKHLSTRRKRKQIVIPKVVASEIGGAQTVGRNTNGVRTAIKYPDG